MSVGRDEEAWKANARYPGERPYGVRRSGDAAGSHGKTGAPETRLVAEAPVGQQTPDSPRGAYSAVTPAFSMIQPGAQFFHPPPDDDLFAGLPESLGIGTPWLRRSFTLFMPPCETNAAARWSTSICGTWACTMKFGGAGLRVSRGRIHAA